LGVVDDETWSDRRGREFGDSLPGGIRGSVHVTLVVHGRSVCTARRPRCGECILEERCPRRGVIDPMGKTEGGVAS
jgi:endonuclease-3